VTDLVHFVPIYKAYVDIKYVLARYYVIVSVSTSEFQTGGSLMIGHGIQSRASTSESA
jgi:hypothetical protein